MSARVTVVVGPARCGKTTRLLDEFRTALANQKAGEAGFDELLWLAPSQRAVENIRSRLLTPEMPGCFGPGIHTFGQFADRILEQADEEILPLDDRMKRRLLERLIEAAAGAGRLAHFASIAETPGFLNLVAQFISELKRVEIWPEEFERACRESPLSGKRGELSPRDRELLAIYGEYQNVLNARRLFDAEGRFWSARKLLKDGQRRPYDRLRLIVVDGFTDFTRTQLEILDELALRSERLLISLPGEEESSRDDLFAKPKATLTQLEKRHPGLKIKRLPRRTSLGGIARIESELFKSPRAVRKSVDTAGVEIVAESGATTEIEELARRIKRLLTVGDGATPGPARPDDIIVVFRALDDAAPLVREIFTRYGIPIAVEAGRPLGQSPSLAALSALVELDAEDWPFRLLLAVTGSNFFRPNWPEWEETGVRAALERTIRLLQIPAGRDKLLHRVEMLREKGVESIEDHDPDAERKERRNARRADAVLAHPVLAKLYEALDALPKKADARQWSASLVQLARETGLWRSLHEIEDVPLEFHDAGTIAADRKAWNRFFEALESDDALAIAVDGHAEEFDRSELRRRIDDVVRREQLPGETDEAGRVRVLSAITARGISAPYLFVAGLTEKAFPSPQAAGRLHSDAEYEQFIRGGLLPLTSAFQRQCDEMLLFYETATRAERRLTLAYPALNEKAEELLPSPYLAELRELFCDDALKPQLPADLRPIPPQGAALNEIDVRVRATALAANGDGNELAAVFHAAGAAGANLARGLSVVAARSRRDEFGAYEGVILGKRAKQLLADRFNDHFNWSAGQLEQYGNCPFQYFLDRVLRVRPPDEVGLEIDHLVRGHRTHAVLKVLHERMNAHAGRGVSPNDVGEDFERFVDEALASVMADIDDDPLAKAFHQIDRRLIRKWLAEYRSQHQKYDAPKGCGDPGIRPRHFEVEFGVENPPDDNVSTSEPLCITLGDIQVRITGRIDRLDIGMVAGRAVFSIIDYKSGSGAGYKPKEVDEGRLLQPTLYAMAAETVLLKAQNATPWQTGYWIVKGRGFQATPAFAKVDKDGEVQALADWTELRERIVQRVVALVRDIRQGRFPMINPNEDCASRCDFGTVCRVGQIRSLEKQWTG